MSSKPLLNDIENLCRIETFMKSDFDKFPDVPRCNMKYTSKLITSNSVRLTSSLAFTVECAIGFLYPSPSSPRHFQIRWTFAKDYDRHMWRMGSRCPCTIWIEISTTCKCKTSPGWTPTVFTPPSPPPWGCPSRFLSHGRIDCGSPTKLGRISFFFHFLTFR